MSFKVKIALCLSFIQWVIEMADEWVNDFDIYMRLVCS